MLYNDSDNFMDGCMPDDRLLNDETVAMMK